MEPRSPRTLSSLLRGDNRRMTAKLAVVAALMFGFGYALVPIYKAICNALGVNVLSVAERGGPGARQAPANTQVDSSRTVTIEFDANARGPWDFKPAVRSLQVHPGEVATVSGGRYYRSNVVAYLERIGAHLLPSFRHGNLP